MILSVESINDNSPYKVQYATNKSFVIFKTDYDVHYLVGFEYDDSSFDFATYQLVIINTNNKKSPRDSTVKDTIIAIIEDFFSNNENVLLYICETGDAKQSMRNRLFQYWFSAYLNKSQFTFVSASVKDEEGIINHAAIILRTDNPDMPYIVSEFSKTINLLNNKP